MRYRAMRRVTTKTGGLRMNWSKPEYEEMRLGFEVNLYVTAR